MHCGTAPQSVLQLDTTAVLLCSSLLLSQEMLHTPCSLQDGSTLAMAKHLQ